jgi:hypothetical protein
MSVPKHHFRYLIFASISLIIFSALFIFSFFISEKVSYDTEIPVAEAREIKEISQELSAPEKQKHITTPSDGVRALYMSSWIAGSKSLRAPIVDLIDTTGLNALVIDLKDVTGRVSYDSQHPDVLAFGDVVHNRISDFPDFIDELHEKDIYVIGRIAVFQDDFSPQYHPNLAVQKKSGGLWSDRRNLEWFDASSQEVWRYIVAIAEDAYSLGIDEINLDYVRFPSDGNTQDILLPITQDQNQAEALEKFFIYINEELRFRRGIPVSADVFGIITTTNHDVGIGQIFENIAPHVDAIAPMIYPSHYPKNFRGYANPADVPYEIITIATQGAIHKFNELGMDATKHLRPWIQDFNLGATYDAAKVTAQMQALYDLGITSFFVWDPANTYTAIAYRNFDFTQGLKQKDVIE